MLARYICTLSLSRLNLYCNKSSAKLRTEPTPSNLNSFLNASLDRDVDIDSSRRPKKRRKTAEAETPSVATDNSAKNPYLEHFEWQKRSSRRGRKNIDQIESNANEYLTLARVDIILVRIGVLAESLVVP